MEIAMAEQDSAGRRSTRLLMVAGALAVAFVVLFNVQGWYERHQRQANQVALVLVTSDLPAGAVLRSDNIKELFIASDEANQLKAYHHFGEGSRIVLGTTEVTRAVSKNSLLRLSDTSPVAADDDDPSRASRRGWRILPLQVDNDSVPVAYVRRGSRVDMYAVLPGAGRPGQMELVIEYLEVMGVDRQVDVDPQRGSFRNVIVQVPEELVGKLLEVKRRAQRLTLVIRQRDDLAFKYPYDRARPDMGGTIAEPIRDELTKPFMPAAAPMAPASGG
jgi:Flp pilus assembly protein CpaB